MALPVRLPWSGDRLWEVLQDWLHFPGAAILYWVCLAGVAGCGLHGGGPSRIVGCFGAVGVLLVSVELVQPLLGRTADVGDLVEGALGALFACGAAAYQRRRRKAVWGGLLVVIVALSLVPVGVVAVDRVLMHRGFPLLAGFEWAGELGRWDVNGGQLRRIRRHATEGEWAGEFSVFGGNPYPGVFLSDMERNWLGMRRLCADLWWSGADGAGLWLRVDDRASPVYGERFQKRLVLHHDLNRIAVPLEEIARTPSGRSLDLRCIHRMGLFLEGARSGMKLTVDNIRLEGVP